MEPISAIMAIIEAMSSISNFFMFHSPFFFHFFIPPSCLHKQISVV